MAFRRRQGSHQVLILNLFVVITVKRENESMQTSMGTGNMSTTSTIPSSTPTAGGAAGLNMTI